MSSLKAVVKNSTAIIIGNVIDKILGFVIAIWTVRYFGQSGFGTLSFLGVFFFLVANLDAQWIRSILIREISRDEKNAPTIIGNGVIIKAILSLLAIILFWGSVLYVRPTSEIIVLSLFTTASLVLTQIASVYEIILMAKLRISFFVFYNFFNKILTLVVIYFITLIKGGLLHYYVLTLSVFVVTLPFLKLQADKFTRPRFVFDGGLWRVVFRESWPLGVSAFFIFIYHRIDHILLFRMKGEDALGFYSAGVRFAESLNVIPAAFTGSLLPFLSKYHDASEINFKRLYETLFKYLLVIIIPVAFYLSFSSEQVVALFYGKAFLPSAPSLVILMWAEVFVFLGVANNTVLVASHKQRIDPVFTGTSALVNIILNLWLLPAYGFMGASVASLAAYSVGPVMGYFIPATRAYSQCMLRHSVKPVIAASVMSLVVYYTRMPFSLSLFAAPAVYCLTIFMMRGVSREDLLVLEESRS